MILSISGGAIALNILFLVLGVLLLVKGADFFVAGASSIARKLKISALVIGLTVVSFGTSAPELAVSLTSSIRGNNGIALGNVVGSNIMNLLVVLGCSVIITPMVVKKSIVKREFPFLLAATFLLIIFSLDNFFSGYTGIANLISRGEALVFVMGLVGFCYLSIYFAKKDAKEAGIQALEKGEAIEEVTAQYPLTKSIIFFLIGLAGIIVGAEFVTTPASTLATEVGLAFNLDANMVTNVVGLTVVAIGTSLPELVTSIVAAKKGENEIALGNVVGSNIFNILFILGLSGIITPLTLASNDIPTDMIISLFITIGVIFMAKKGELTRKNGIVLLSVYFAYLAYILVRLFVPMLVLPL